MRKQKIEDADSVKQDNLFKQNRTDRSEGNNTGVKPGMEIKICNELLKNKRGRKDC